MTDIPPGSLADANKAILALYEGIGVRVRALRKERGLRQDELGAQVGLMRSSMANVEAGRQRTPLHTLIALAQCLGTDLQSLCGDREMPTLGREIPARRRDWERDARTQVERMRADVAKFETALSKLADGLGDGAVRDA